LLLALQGGRADFDATAASLLTGYIAQS